MPDSEEPSHEPVTVEGGQFLLRAEVVQFQRGDLLGGRYQIEKAIGRGATGAVLQAFDRVVRSVVAVKILRPDLATDEHWVERLGGELRYARKLQHPNVCRVFDLGEADGHHFLTMEFAGGGSLRQRLAEKPDRSWDDRIADARAVIQGLIAIHAANIVHRDVKPENVLVMDDGRLVVSDFGVAVSAGQTTYFSSKVAGTPSYMAPEVIMGEKATPRADVFSLGIVLHEILFGRRPDWQMTKQGRVMRSTLGRKASTRERAFERLCTECLREFAPDRLPDAAAVMRRFEQAVDGRLRPIRGLRQRWPLVLGAVALAASVGIVIETRTLMPARVSKAEPAQLTGKAADLGAVSRAVFTSERQLRCFDVLPDRKTARIVWNRPAEVVDVDLATGAKRPTSLVPDAYRAGCPQLSPDGNRLLFVKDDENRRSQIMLSSHPDGSDASVVTEGSDPLWLPSGSEFLYSFDSRRAAAFAFPKSRLLFPDSAPFQKTLLQIAVNPRGDKAALLFVDSRRQVSIEIYSYPSLNLVQRTQLDRFVGGIQFDAERGTLQVSIPDSRTMALTELTEGNTLARVGMIDGVDVLGAFRTIPGLTLLTRDISRALVLHDTQDATGTERTFGPVVTVAGDVATDGAVIFDRRLDDGRFAIAYKDAEALEPRLVTEGPVDLYPSFGKGASSFVFVRTDQNAIVSCELGTPKVCRTLFVDPLGPVFTSVSPDGALVAYRTAHGSNSRFRILSTGTGEMQDLGIYRSKCPPIWASASSMWLTESDGLVWTEVDVASGRPTGHTAAATGTGAQLCESAPRPDGSSQRFSLHHRELQRTQIRVAR